MADGSLAIDLEQVSKTYRGRVRALEGVQMQVRRGEIFGLLGPNGAGKSTLVKIMMSVVKPTSAVGQVLEKPVGSKGSLERVGYLPEHHRFPRYLTGRQTLEFFAALSGVGKETRKERAKELLETVGMTAWADRRVGDYSKGMMQRVGVAAALVNDPQLVILDEPTDGVDPVGRREIRDVLVRMKKEGRTVFINSHLLSELEVVSDRVAILVAGRVVKQGTLNELTVGRQYFELEVAADRAEQGLKRALGERLKGTWPAPPTAEGILRGALGTGEWVEIQGSVARVGTVDVGAAQGVIDAVRGEGLAIRRWVQMRPSLEDLFIEAVGGVAGGHNAGAAMGGVVKAPPVGGFRP
ncbi:MAG TPA: ABC transporter ATP-binding protein [Phycisphaerae bacterium]|nr:ABC transporter ATP-binding protein [Phycisphaerae bacterium]